jgi:hypothetical protein
MCHAAAACSACWDTTCSRCCRSTRCCCCCCALARHSVASWLLVHEDVDGVGHIQVQLGDAVALAASLAPPGSSVARSADRSPRKQCEETQLGHVVTDVAGCMCMCDHARYACKNSAQHAAKHLRRKLAYSQEM